MALGESEVRGRVAKAYRLADVLTAHHADPRSAAALPDEGREMVADLAGVRPPSPATWVLVAAILADRETQLARLIEMWVRDEDIVSRAPTKVAPVA